MDDSIRQGRDPDWQRAFYDRLDRAARARVRHAVRHGGRLADPNEAAVAAGLAHRHQRMLGRHALIILPLQLGLTLTWLGVLLPPARLPDAFRWLWAGALTCSSGWHRCCSGTGICSPAAPPTPTSGLPAVHDR